MSQDDDFSIAAKQMFEVHNNVLALRDFPDVHLQTDRLFSSTARFGENVLGDSAAILGEALIPLIGSAAKGAKVEIDLTSESVLSLRVAETSPKIKAIVSNDKEENLFQIDLEIKADGGFSVALLDPPYAGPEYRFQNTFFSATIQAKKEWSLHPVGLGYLHYCDFNQAIEAFSVLRPVVLKHASNRELDPKQFNMRSMNLMNYEELLKIDGGVFGPACAWAAKKQFNESVEVSLREMSSRFVEVHDRLRDLGVEWGRSYYVYHNEDHYTTVVKSDDFGKTALFDLWVDWSFRRQALLGVITRDSNGDPLEVTFNQLSRGNGEFRRIEEAVTVGSFQGMPTARYSFATGIGHVDPEFLVGGGLEVLETVCRHTHSTLNEPEGSDRAGDIREDFAEIYGLDLDDEQELDGGPGF